MQKTMGQAVDEAVALHEKKYHGSEVYLAIIKKDASRAVWLVEISASHFSVPMTYVVDL